MTKPNKQKVNWAQFPWILMGFVMPLAFVIYSAYVLLQSTRIEFSLVLPIVVGMGAIAGVIHFWTLKRTKKLRLLLHGIFAVSIISLAIVLQIMFRYAHETYLTCEICGFRTLEVSSELCPVCNVIVSDSSASDEDYASLDEYIAAEQIMFFMPDPPSSQIDFFAPYTGPEGYQKDSAWQPKVSLKDMYDVLEIIEDEAPLPSSE